jgi:RNA polymerase sigma-70 factor (ECF subfamily)
MDHPDRVGDPDWKEVVAGIEREDRASGETLYAVFSHGVRYLMARQLGWKDVDDRVHDVFLIVLDAIRHGQLREPDKLMGFVQTIVKRQIVANIRLAVRSRRTEAYIDISVPDAHDDPEQNAAWRERVALMKTALLTLTVRDRELLTRFYLYDQTEPRICKEMRLTTTQFRLYKSRAKQKVGSMGLDDIRKKPRNHQPPSSTSRAS